MHSRYVFWEEKVCLATCLWLYNRSQGCSSAIKNNALRVVFFHVADEEHGFELQEWETANFYDF